MREQIDGRPELAGVAEPLLAAWRAVRDQIAALDRKLIEAVKGDATCRLLMTCPGVGVVVAASFSAAVEAPGHFRRSRSVGAYLGLTPKRHQSGETDHSAGVSKRGDKLLRSYLFEAAACLLVRVQRSSALKAWGLKLVQRLGFSVRPWRSPARSGLCSMPCGSRTPPLRPGHPPLPPRRLEQAGSTGSARQRRTQASPPGRDVGHPAVGLAAG